MKLANTVQHTMKDGFLLQAIQISTVSITAVAIHSYLFGGPSHGSTEQCSNILALWDRCLDLCGCLVEHCEGFTAGKSFQMVSQVPQHSHIPTLSKNSCADLQSTNSLSVY